MKPHRLPYFFNRLHFIFSISFFLLLIAFGLLFSLVNFMGQDIWLALGFFGMGIFIWTLVEYLLNRFTLHDYNQKGLLKKFAAYHKNHHARPNNPDYMMMPLGLIITVATGLSVLVWVLAGMLCFPFVIGFLSGYIFFVVLHSTMHFFPCPANPILGYYWKNHMLHHSRYPDRAYSVTLPLWDILLGTQVPGYQVLEGNPAKALLNICEVSDPATEEAFFSLPAAIYHDEPYWVAPLESEVKTIFDRTKNPYFNHGVAKRWVVTDKDGIVVGRIAAFMNFHKMYEEGKKVGGIGFFECINDRAVAFKLFDTAFRWLKEHYQVQSVIGPVNFGENDKFWGLLVEGQGYPSYGMNYNPAYYQELFEAYGFKIQYKQFTNVLDLRKPLPARFVRIASRVKANPRNAFKHFDYGQTERFIDDFVSIYNQAWASFKNFQPMKKEYLRNSLMEIKPVVEETFIWFAYVDGEPAGLLVGMPDINEILKYVDGKLNLWGKIKFFTLKQLKGFTTSRVVIMGIIPKYQNLGLESGLILNAYNAGKKLPSYKWVQLAWVGDFNDKMIAIHKAMGAVPDKTHATFRKEG
jgi:hypothetical protein